MSFVKPGLLQIVKKLYFFKLKSFNQVFSNLIFLQLIAIFFSFGGSGGMGGGSDSLQMEVRYYSGDTVMIFTCLWVFVTAIYITTKAYRYDDFLFVSNRVSSNIANGLFLLTSSIIGGITAILSPSIIKIFMYYFFHQPYVNNEVSPSGFLMGLIAAILYIFLFSALGYLVGTLVQIHKGFILLLPVIFIGASILGEGNFLGTVLGLIFTETNFLLFIAKIVVISGLLFTSTFAVSNRLEVRQ